MDIKKLNEELDKFLSDETSKEVLETKQQYLLINIETAECILFNNLPEANRFIANNHIVVITKNSRGDYILVPAYEDYQDPEIILYDSSKSNMFPYIAQYQDDLTNYDLITSSESAIRYTLN